MLVGEVRGAATALIGVARAVGCPAGVMLGVPKDAVATLGSASWGALRGAEGAPVGGAPQGAKAARGARPADKASCDISMGSGTGSVASSKKL